MSEYHPWEHPDDPMWPEPPQLVRQPRDQGEHPVVDPVNRDKMQFMLNYFIAARRGGRSVDCGSSVARNEIVHAASDLYDRTYKVCKGE